MSKVYHMINILAVSFLLSFVKLLIEDSLLLILMSMEMISMLTFFITISLNPDVLSLTTCTVVMLTVMVSESVLSLSIFISLMRSSSMDKLQSSMTSKY